MISKKIIKTFLILVVILISTKVVLCVEASIILKVNPLMGERYVTKLPQIERIERIFKNNLELKGFRVFTISEELENEIINEKDLYFFDIFVYQYPANFPTIKIIIRNENGVLYEDQDYIKHFTDRQIANEKIAQTLAEKIPKNTDLSEIPLKYSIESFGKNNYSIIGITTNSMMEIYVNKYLIEFEFEGTTTVNFIYGDSVEEYIKNLINYTGYRSKVREKKIKIYIEIDEYGFTRILKKEIPKGMKAKFIQRIDNIVKGFPLWQNKKRKRTRAVITIGTK